MRIRYFETRAVVVGLQEEATAFSSVLMYLLSIFTMAIGFNLLGEEAKEMKIIISAAADNCINVTLQSMLNETVSLIDKVSPEFSIIKIYRIDKMGAEKALRLPEQADWIAFPKDCTIIKPGEKFSRVISLSWLDPGSYLIRAKYAISKESFFLTPWFRELRNSPDGKKMREIWQGEIVSNDVNVIIHRK